MPGNKTAQRIDSFASCKFHVLIESAKTAGSKVAKKMYGGSYFSECSGLEMSTEVFEYQEGGLNEYVHKIPGRTKFGNVTLKRGFMHLNEFYKLFTDMEGELLKSRAAMTRYLVTIELHNPAITGGVIKWTLSDAFPVKWVAPSLKADDTSVAIESLEFAHHGIAVDVTPPSERGG